ncbi:MAG TPA: ATP-binding cassette domain-containing protein [Candidatus Binatia bacterium]|nr:ATP-binding cassette domain-containing protein [Candidatus Binatia bacterium]
MARSRRCWRSNGADIATLAEDALAGLRSNQIGFIFQFHYLLEEFTCLENVLMPITIRHGAATPAERDRMVHLLTRVGLGDQLHKHPEEMRGGQKQRCAVVRALANEPDIVLAESRRATWTAVPARRCSR